MGAEVLLYPTAIGSEPVLPRDTKTHWQNVMCGHAAANIIPVVASNRIGTECEGDSSMTFYGSSFITDNTGEIIASAGREEETVIMAEFDLEQYRKDRQSWGLFRDRRPDKYDDIAK